MTQHESQQVKDSLQMMRNYPKLLLLELGQKGKEEVKLELSRDRRIEVDKMVEKVDNQLQSKVSESLPSKIRQIWKLLDEGFALDIAKEHRWHKSHKESKNFLANLDQTNFSTLSHSFLQLTKSRDKAKKNQRDRDALNVSSLQYYGSMFDQQQNLYDTNCTNSVTRQLKNLPAAGPTVANTDADSDSLYSSKQAISKATHKSAPRFIGIA